MVCWESRDRSSELRPGGEHVPVDDPGFDRHMPKVVHKSNDREETGMG